MRQYKWPAVHSTTIMDESIEQEPEDVKIALEAEFKRMMRKAVTLGLLPPALTEVEFTIDDGLGTSIEYWPDLSRHDHDKIEVTIPSAVRPQFHFKLHAAVLKHFDAGNVSKKPPRTCARNSSLRW